MEDWIDFDCDGVADAAIRCLDTDSDGAADTLILMTGQGEYVHTTVDTDGDEIPDSALTYADLDGDGLVDQPLSFQRLAPERSDALPVSHLPTTEPAPDFFAVAPEFGHTNPAQPLNGLVGYPEGETERWHEQSYPDTCAVVVQEFMLEGVTGEEFSEDELRREALERGWYTPGRGTALGDMGNLIEARGIPVEREYGCTLWDLSRSLESGGKVMVALDVDEIWTPEFDDDEMLPDYQGIPGTDVNHAVEVIGVDYSDPERPAVILNDPGTAEGKGLTVPVDDFLNAWADSGFYAVSTA